MKERQLKSGLYEVKQWVYISEDLNPYIID